MTSGGNNFKNFPENQLTKFSAVGVRHRQSASHPRRPPRPPPPGYATAILSYNTCNCGSVLLLRARRVDLEFATWQSSWPSTESQHVKASAEDIPPGTFFAKYWRDVLSAFEIFW